MLKHLKRGEKALATLGRIGRVATALGILLSALGRLPETARDVKAAVHAVKKPSSKE